MKAAANLAVVFVILVWGMTFANTRALLEDFSALEIQFLWFALAWAMLWVWEGGRGLGRRSRGDRPTSAGDGRAEDGGRNARALPRRSETPIVG